MPTFRSQFQGLDDQDLHIRVSRVIWFGFHLTVASCNTKHNKEPLQTQQAKHTALEKMLHQETPYSVNRGSICTRSEPKQLPLQKKWSKVEKKKFELGLSSNQASDHRIILVLAIGARDSITPPRRQYIPGI